jgi:hypothetical protein
MYGNCYIAKAHNTHQTKILIGRIEGIIRVGGTNERISIPVKEKVKR